MCISYCELHSAEVSLLDEFNKRLDVDHFLSNIIIAMIIIRPTIINSIIIIYIVMFRNRLEGLV